MQIIEVRTQSELDVALSDVNADIRIIGDGYFEIYGSSQVTAYGSSQVTAYGSSQVTACDSSQVRAYGSSQVTAYGSSQVTAYGSSQVRAYDSSQVTARDSSQVTARDSSQVTACDSSQVTAYGSSQVRAYGSSQVRAYGSSQVTACDSSQVTACDSSQVTASRYVAVTVHGSNCLIEGGVVIKLPKIRTAAEWCEFYGVEVVDGVVILYKALDDKFQSAYGFDYTPGTIPIAPDWDGGKIECGKGLHFSPRPFMALAFAPDAKRFVACPIKIDDIAVHPNAQMPQKIKARGCCAPVYEVDIDGKRIDR